MAISALRDVKCRSYSKSEDTRGVKEQLVPWLQLLILQMKLFESAELLQTLHHWNSVPTQIPGKIIRAGKSPICLQAQTEDTTQNINPLKASALTVWRVSSGWRDYPYEWCCCSADTDGWGWRQSPGCKSLLSDSQTGKAQWGSCTWTDLPKDFKCNLKRIVGETNRSEG